MKKTNEITLKISEEDAAVAYLYMPTEHLSDKKIFKTIDIFELVDNYQGIPIYLDFNKNNELIGIEISG
jgi:hypothetical protein